MITKSKLKTKTKKLRILGACFLIYYNKGPIKATLKYTPIIVFFKTIQNMLT